MLKFKKMVLALTLVVVFTTAASAFVPLAYVAAVVGPELAPYVTASLYIHGAAAITGLFYYMKQGGQSKVTPDNNIDRPSGETWIDTKDIPDLHDVPVNTRLSVDDAAKMALDNPSKYPAIAAAARRSMFSVVGLGPESDCSGISGQNVQTTNDNGARKLGTYQGQTRNNSGSYFGYSPPDAVAVVLAGSDIYITIRNASWQTISGVSGYYGTDKQWKYTDAGAAQAVIRNTTKNEMSRILTDSQPIEDSPLPSSKPVESAYQEELDKMLQDPSYVPKFTDDTTGLPHAAPALGDIRTPQQVADYNKAGANAENQAAADAARNAAVAAAQAAADGANARAATAAAAAAGNPGDAGLAAAAAAAQAAADAANAALKNAQAAKAGADAATSQKEQDEKAADVPTGSTPLTIDMAPLHALKGALDNTYPFNLPGVIAGYYNKLVAPAEVPVFDLPLPLGQTLHVDLAVMEPIAILFRYMIGIVATAGALFYVVHFFRGIS